MWVQIGSHAQLLLTLGQHGLDIPKTKGFMESSYHIPYSVELRYLPSLTPFSPPNIDANVQPNKWRIIDKYPDGTWLKSQLQNITCNTKKQIQIHAEIKPIGLLPQEKLKAKVETPEDCDLKLQSFTSWL